MTQRLDPPTNTKPTNNTMPVFEVTERVPSERVRTLIIVADSLEEAVVCYNKGSYVIESETHEDDEGDIYSEITQVKQN